MAGFNYNKMYNTAKNLIAKFGKVVTWRQFVVTPADPNKEWLGNTKTPVDTPIKMAFVPINRVGEESQHFVGNGITQYGNAETVVGNVQGLFVPPTQSFVPTMEGVVIDQDGKELRLTNLSIIKPATITVLIIAEFLL